MNVSLLEKWVSCIMNADLEALLAMYKPNALLFATFEQKPLDTPSLIRDYFTNFLSREGAGVELDPQTITHTNIGESISSSTGLYTFFLMKMANSFDKKRDLLLSSMKKTLVQYYTIILQ